MANTITGAIARKVLSTVDAGLCSGVGNPVPGEMCVEAAVCYALGEPHGDNPSCVAAALRALKIALNDEAWSSNAARAKGMRRLALIQLGSKGALDEVEFVKQVTLKTVQITVVRALNVAIAAHPDDIHKAKLRAAADACFGATTLEAAARAASYAARAAAAASYAASHAISYPASYAATAASYAARAAAASYAASHAISYPATTAARAAAAASYAASHAISYPASYAARAAAAASYAASHAISYPASYAATAASYAARAARAASDAATARDASDAELSGFAEMVVQILVGMGAPGACWLYLTDAR